VRRMSRLDTEVVGERWRLRDWTVRVEGVKGFDFGL
jgi:hypothetical protein